MFISVIIPIYKVEKYIRRCLESVADQVCCGFSIECILVDDCSPDKSMDVAKEFIEGNQKEVISFVMLRHDENKGLSAARNSGIRAAKGDFLIFIDSDDAIMENTFLCMVRQFIDFPHVDVVMGNSLCVGVNVLTNTPVTGQTPFPCILDDVGKIWDLYLKRKMDHHAWNKMIRRSFIIDNNLFFDDGLIYEDIPWTYRLFSCASSIVIVPGLTYLYEYNPNSVIHTTAEKAELVIKSFVMNCRMMLESPPPFDPKNKYYVINRIHLFHWLLFAVDHERLFGCSDEMKNSLRHLKKDLMWDAVRHFRLMLFLLFLIIFPPFTNLLRYRLFRSNIERLEKMTYMISMLTDWMHRLH